jgi:hypothetical protein
MVQDLLHRIKPNETNLAGQIRDHLEAELPKYLVCSRGFNQARKAIKFVIRLALTPPTDLKNYSPETRRLGPSRIADAWIAAKCIFSSLWNNPHADKEFIFNISTKVELPKYLWKKLNSEINEAFTKDQQLFGEGKYSSHTMCCASCEKEIHYILGTTDWTNSPCCVGAQMFWYH